MDNNGLLTPSTVRSSIRRSRSASQLSTPPLSPDTDRRFQHLSPQTTVSRTSSFRSNATGYQPLTAHGMPKSPASMSSRGPSQVSSPTTHRFAALDPIATAPNPPTTYHSNFNITPTTPAKTKMPRVFLKPKPPSDVAMSRHSVDGGGERALEEGEGEQKLPVLQRLGKKVKDGFRLRVQRVKKENNRPLSDDVSPVGRHKHWSEL